MNPQAFGTFAALLTAIAWGGMFPIFGVLLKRLDPFWLTSIRYAGAALLLVVILACVEGVRAFRLDRRWLLLAAISTCAIAGFNLLVLSGMQHSTPEHGSLMVAMGPAFVALLTWMRTRIAPRPAVLATILTAFVGVALVATKGDVKHVLHTGSIAGDAVMAGGVLCFSVYTLFARDFHDWGWLRFTTLSVGLGTIATLLVTFAATALGYAHLPHTAVDATVFWGLGYMIVAAAVIAFILWNFSIQAIGAQNTVLFMNAVPIVAFAIALLHGERFSPLEYLGAGLTVIALAAANLAGRATPAAAPQRTRSAA